MPANATDNKDSFRHRSSMREKRFVTMELDGSGILLMHPQRQMYCSEQSQIARSNLRCSPMSNLHHLARLDRDEGGERSQHLYCASTGRSKSKWIGTDGKCFPSPIQMAHSVHPSRPN